MEEEIKRIEEKQKLTNLQIDKRLSELEMSVDRLTTEIENVLSIKETGKTVESISSFEVNSIKDDIERIKQMRKEELQQIASLAEKYETGIESKEFHDLMKEMLKMRVDLMDKVNDLEKLQNDLIAIESRGQLPQCSEKINNVEYNLKVISEKVSKLENIFVKVISKINALDSSRAVVIE